MKVFVYRTKTPQRLQKLRSSTTLKHVVAHSARAGYYSLKSPLARTSQSLRPLHRKRESKQYVNGCKTQPIGLRARFGCISADRNGSAFGFNHSASVIVQGESQPLLVSVLHIMQVLDDGFYMDKGRGFWVWNHRNCKDNRQLVGIVCWFRDTGPTKRQGIGNQIKAAFVFARPGFRIRALSIIGAASVYHFLIAAWRQKY